MPFGPHVAPPQLLLWAGSWGCAGACVLVQGCALPTLLWALTPLKSFNPEESRQMNHSCWFFFFFFFNNRC